MGQNGRCVVARRLGAEGVRKFKVGEDCWEGGWV